LWVGDVDLDRGTVRVNKAWKRHRAFYDHRDSADRELVVEGV
jgi:hypothetical protein